MKFYFSAFLAFAAISMNTFCSAHESSVDHVHEIDFKWNIEDTTLIESLSDMSTTYEEKTEKIYLVGGCNDPQGNAKAPDSDYFFCNTITDSTYSFDPVTKEIKKLANAPRARYRHTAAAVDGNIYVLGGRTVPDDAVIPEIDVSIYLNELSCKSKYSTFKNSPLHICHYYYFNIMYRFIIQLKMYGRL